MMRPIPLATVAIRCAFGVASCAYALAGSFSLTAYAVQVRSVTEGVYSSGQASRGQQIYRVECAECHGTAMEGASGPPLVGDSFLSNWSARPLANLVDKIQKTMPFSQPGSLSRQQSIELAAYILQAGKFPSGESGLSEDTLSQIAFPTARPSPAVAAGGGRSLP